MLLESSAVSGFSGYASDIWATGVCLFIFVLGRTPFKGGGDEGVLQCFEDIRTLDPCESLPEDMSPECAALMRALLTKDWKVSLSRIGSNSNANVHRYVCLPPSIQPTDLCGFLPARACAPIAREC
jgi:serine/threonine protein kinase